MSFFFLIFFLTNWKFNCKKDPKYNQHGRTNATQVEIKK